MLSIQHDHLYDSLDNEKGTPILSRIEITNEIKSFENGLPIHRKIYVLANMKIYEYYNKTKELNSIPLFIGIKTDCLLFDNVNMVFVYFRP